MAWMRSSILSPLRPWSRYLQLPTIPSTPLSPPRRSDFQIGDVDLVTDRNNIRKLLRFVQGSSGNAFQIAVEVAGSKSALFTRTETKTTDVIRGFRGYGHNFEKAYTKGPEGCAHHRIISYKFGDMNCIVRHETDGYVDNKGPRELGDNLLDALEGLSISKSDNVVTDPAVTIVKTGGKAVDPSSTLEIKTRVASRKIEMAEVFPQLWISQTLKLVVGYHRNGIFDDIQLRDMTNEIRQWETTNQRDLSKLACLPVKIIGVVKHRGDRRAVVRYDGGTRLRIVASERKRALPDDLYAKWEGSDDESEATSGKQLSKQETTGLLIPYGTPFSDIIDYAARKGLRQFFRRMPTLLSDYRVLCKTLEFLSIDVLGGREMRDIMDDMRRGKSDWDPVERREIEGSKGLVRDSAFRLLYLFLYRTRMMIRAAFEAQFRVSDKQRKNLDKWPLGSQEDEVQDATTEEEGIDLYFDSDYDS
ncbi:hypothetical protein GE09DRAFT_1178184 [Coniochaeta sp. 2T2.1]|nr:hypothetical protein GE09DRAFT_1178184 [Coniochaeta sp. 2T2.1]